MHPAKTFVFLSHAAQHALLTPFQVTAALMLGTRLSGQPHTTEKDSGKLTESGKEAETWTLVNVRFQKPCKTAGVR